MEWRDGRSLQAVLDAGRPIGWERVFEIAGAVCAAFADARARGAPLHRITPVEIFLVIPDDAPEYVELRDPVDTRDDPRTFHPYASPEAMTGKPLDARSDIYVIGVIAYELLTGARPFARAEQTPQRPSAALAEAKLPLGVDLVLLRCLEKHPTRRYGDHDELARALVEVTGGLTPLRPPPKPAPAPVRRPQLATSLVNQVVSARPCGVRGCTAKHRVIPAPGRTAIGNWMFVDHYDTALAARADAGPHPHVGLATLTYLFDGRLVHRDSLGNTQPIKPGALNWLTAGRGVVHTERMDPVDRLREARLHGLELWAALPVAREDDPPAFVHHDAGELPSVVIGGVRVRVVLGEGFGARSPVVTPMPLTLFDVRLPAGAAVPVTAPRGRSDVRGVYVVAGAIDIAGTMIDTRSLAVLAPHQTVPVVAADGAPAHIIVLGSAPLGGSRFSWWNFIATSKERIESAKQRWAADAFGTIDGESERVLGPPK